MCLGYKKILESQPWIIDINNWPTIDETLLNKSQRKKFLRNLSIISGVLKGEKYSLIASEHNINASFISYLLKRSLSLDSHGSPTLTPGLIPNLKLIKATRKSPLSHISNNKGNRCSFSNILELNPEIKNELDSTIYAFTKKKNYSQNLTPRTFHQLFIKCLKDANWNQLTYPFNTEKLAYESCRKYLHKKHLEFSLPKERQQKPISINYSKKKPFQEIQIDTQLLDINLSVNFEFNGLITTLRMSRPSLILAVDVASNAYIAYELCISKDPSRFEILSLLEKLHKPQKKRKLRVKDINYLPGAGFPTSKNDLFRRVNIGQISFDNALSHHANLITQYVCKTIHSCINFGLPATPKTRNTVEYAFNKLNSNLIHRFASTTGKNNTDPNKESSKNSKTPPLVSFEEFIDIIDVELANHNVKPLLKLNSLSPLQVMENYIVNNLLPINAITDMRFFKPYLARKTALVKHIKSDKRKPHINFKSLRYTGECLNRANLVGSKVSIEFDCRDIRKLTVFDSNQRYLGEVFAPTTWQTSTLSIRTRERINRAYKNKKIDSDTLAKYFENLLNNKSRPKFTTELLRVCLENQGVDQNNKLSTKKTNEIKPKRDITSLINTVKHKKIKPWRQLR